MISVPNAELNEAPIEYVEDQRQVIGSARSAVAAAKGAPTKRAVIDRGEHRIVGLVRVPDLSHHRGAVGGEKSQITNDKSQTTYKHQIQNGVQVESSRPCI